MPKVKVLRPFELGLGYGAKSFKVGVYDDKSTPSFTEEDLNHWAIPGLIESGALVLQVSDAPDSGVKELDYRSYRVHFPESGQAHTLKEVAPVEPVKEEKTEEVSEETKEEPEPVKKRVQRRVRRG